MEDNRLRHSLNHTYPIRGKEKKQVEPNHFVGGLVWDEICIILIQCFDLNDASEDD